MKTNCHDCCYPEVIDNKACGCCEGIEPLTPLPTANRPGLSQLSYRIGSHSSFLETMIARLSNKDYPQLAGLTTRDANDPSIALLDGWASVADVLTFYQERIANEGYLRCATERRSILKLARLVGYKLRPGVSSSVFLAYTIDENTQGETTIPTGSRSQSIPGPDELPQSFETSEDLKARAKWNNLRPRMTQPQTSETIVNNLNGPRVYLKGINSNLKSNDPLLISFGAGTPAFYRVKQIEPDAIADRTLVTLQPAFSAAGTTPADAVSHLSSTLDENYETRLIKELTRPPSRQVASSLRLTRNLENQFLEKSEAGYSTSSTFTPLLRDTLSVAVANIKAAPDSVIKVYALRAEASLFGHNAPKEPQYEPTLIPGGGEFPEDVANPKAGNLKPQPWPEWQPDEEYGTVLYLDRIYNEIIPYTHIVVQKPDQAPMDFTGTNVHAISRSAYGMSGETTKITLNAEWWNPDPEADISELRTTKTYAQPEELELAEEPIDEPIGRCTSMFNQTVTDSGVTIELDSFYDGLESGRWVIVSGERAIAGTSGVRFSELAMLASVTQDVRKVSMGPGYPEQPRAGEKNHTFIKLAEELQYCFKRDTVRIYGNVVKATHGETRNEVLGSGDGSKTLQSFALKQPPLTHVSASNPTGVDSTLSVFVNDVEWHETDSLAGLHGIDRLFVTKADDDSKTSVIFGNGREGARLPTGVENIRAEYRNGIGKGGNINAEQITLLATKPLGVKEVINPLRASGGADKENRDQARKSAPLAVMALDRLVSVRDYQDFSRLYAGIGKADAVETSDGRRQLVHVTIAGADNIPIDETSDLFINLRRALHDFGDPFQPIQLAVRELMFVVISANVQIQADYQWESVVMNLRAALLDDFGFEHRELGQDVVLSEVMSVMQAVPGVAYIDVDTFGGIPEKQADTFEPGKRRLLTPDEITAHIQTLIATTGEMKRPEPRLRVNLADFEQGAIRPAQLAFLTPDVPDTLILNQIK